MGFAFGTCVEKTALRFLRGHYPEKTVTEENAAGLLEYVKADKMRVTDPEYHGPGMIMMQGKQFQASEQEDIMVVWEQFREGLTDKA